MGKKTLSYFIDWFPNKPLRLKRGGIYRIGRGSRNEIFLPEAEASRRHAEISWNGEAFVLEDLESANGTLVNGGPISEHDLRHGDEIRIGNRVLTFRVEKSARFAEEFKRQAEEVQTEKTVIGQPSGEGGLSGAIEDVNLFEIVQMLEAGRKTGRLLVTSVGVSGWLYVKNGRVIAAQYRRKRGAFEGELADSEAACAILVLKEGIFEFLVEEVDIEPRITQSTQALLLESMRRLDEARRAERKAISTSDTQIISLP